MFKRKLSIKRAFIYLSKLKMKVMKIETVERIEMLVNYSDVIKLKIAIENIADAMLNDGFEYSDVKEYIQTYLNEILGE
jgi:AmiR/NasT family two-component response regulator